MSLEKLEARDAAQPSTLAALAAIAGNVASIVASLGVMSATGWAAVMMFTGHPQAHLIAIALVLTFIVGEFRRPRLV